MRLPQLGFLGLLFGFASLAATSVSADEAVVVNEDSFGCILEMTPVRGFFVDNLLGDLEATLQVAKSEDGGRYPAGSVVQLVPGEAMVKLAKDTNPATQDWEFFELTVSPQGSAIAKRGFTEVINKFGGNCFDCHNQAEPQWDLVCETGHGCNPLPLTADMVAVIQKTDPRCANKPELSAKEVEMLGQLQQLLQQ